MSWNTFRSKSSRRNGSNLIVPADPNEVFSKRMSVRDADVAQDGFCNALLHHMKRFFDSFNGPVKIICYGIGSIFESPISQYQYSLLKLIRNSLENSSCGIYDPVFSESEIEWLAKDYFRLISFPSSSYVAKSREGLIFFMPHCESFVYEAWLEDLLGFLEGNTEFLMFGNDISSYSSPNLKGLVAKLDHSIISIPTTFAHRNDVFNDCYLQIIRIKR